MFTKIKSVKSQFWFVKITKAISEDELVSFSNKVVYYDAYCSAVKGRFDVAMKTIADSAPAKELFKAVNAFVRSFGFKATYEALHKIIAKFS